MHVRRIACLLLGMWLGGSILMAVVATQNFQSVNRVLGEPTEEVEQVIQKLGGVENTRLFLRYHAAEQNRFYFENWEILQLALGLGLFLLLLFGTHERKRTLALTMAMFLITLLAHLAVTPSIKGLGRELDFIPTSANSPLRNQFRAWHMAYSAIEIVKLIVGVLLTVLLVTGNGIRHRIMDSTTEPRESAVLRR